MKRNTLLLGVVCSALLALGAAQAQDIDGAVNALKAYKFGDSRAAFTVLENEALNSKTDPALRAKLEQAFLGVIKSDASIDARRFACRQLDVVGTEASVDTLVGLIGDDAIADYAVRALVALPGDAAEQGLLKALAEGPQAQKANVVNALARRGAETAVPALVGLLDDDDKAVAQAAVAALGSIGGKGCTELLARLKAKGTDGGTVLADACLQCGQWMPESKKSEALALYNVLYVPEQPGYVRAAALTGLVRLEPEKAQEYVVGAMADADPSLVLVAAGFIRDLPGEEATKTFAGMLANAEPRSKILIIDALAHRGEPGALEAIGKAAKSDDGAVQLAALSALGRLGNQDTAPMLLDLAANAEGEVQRAARASLKTIPGQQTDVAILKVAREGSGAAQLEAIGALAGRRAVKTTPALLELAGAADPAVRAESLKALRVLAGDDDLGTLLGLLASAGDDDQRKNVSQTIVDVAGRIREEGAKTELVRASLAKSSDDPTKAALIGILGRIATDDALAVVREHVKSANPALKLAAVEALAAWPDARPMEDLHQLATATDDEAARGVAFDGYIRLLRASHDLNPAEKLAALKAADELATTDQEKKLVVAGVSEVSSMEALQYVEARQQDPAVAAEATQAVIRIAGNISGAYREEIARRMNTYIQQDTNEAVKKLAQNVLDGLAGYEDYITAWQFAGPYYEEGVPATNFFDKQYSPETDPDSVNWSLTPMGLDRGQPWKVHFAQFIGGEERVAYLRTTITSASRQDVILEVGSNDGCKVWWNGELLEALNVPRGLSPGQDQLPVTLKAGENKLMIAVYQHGGDWAATARLRTKDGQAVTGITQSAK